MTIGGDSDPARPVLYEVSIGHVRNSPITNTFRYGSYMWLFDLDRPPVVPGPLRPLARYVAADHLDVRAELDQAGIRPARITVLTNLRVMGHVFNPISVYWCYDGGGGLLAHVAEVHNTYGGRHAYVLPANDPEEHCVAKAMYVSPFYPVDGSYRIDLSDPGESVSVRVTLQRPGDRPFRAWLTGRRVEASTGRLLREVARYPLAPLRARALVQYQGMKLWRKGLEVQPR